MWRSLRRLTLAAAACAAPGVPAAAAEPAVDFYGEVWPILQGSCAECHIGAEVKGGLAMTSREAFVAGGESGPALVPGDSDASRMIARVRAEGWPDQMPPEERGRLSEDQIATLAAWVDAGAPWPERDRHWAFVPPGRPPLPDGPAAHPIDRLVRARLAEAGLRPAERADRVTLLRRLSLDLVGLPPTLEELDAWLADAEPGAWERQVERLLASPHYGERWARLWLDAARYADSDGFEKDKPRSVWFYRDWVIRALNRDLPFDRFVVEQVAGDLLPGATQDQLVATGYLRNSMVNEEGGSHPEQFRMEAMFDRIDAIGKGVLGLTVQCAQCHDHKFDPLSQAEYYRMLAFLNNSHEGSRSVYTPDEQARRAELLRQVADFEDGLRHATPDWERRLARWEERVRGDQPEWKLLEATVEEISTGGSKYLPRDDGSFLAQGYAPTRHRVKLSARVEDRYLTAFRLELLTDPDLPRGGPGRSVRGTAALTELSVEVAPASAPDAVSEVAITGASADVNPQERPLDPIFDDRSDRRRVTGPVSFAIDGKDETAWGIDVGPFGRNQPRKAVFEAAAPVAGFEGGTLVHVYLTQNHGGWNSDDNQNHNLGRLRLSYTTDPGAAADPLPAAVRAILPVPPDERTPAQRHRVFSYWRTTVPEWEGANARIAALEARHPEGASQLVLQEREEPRATHLLARGDFLKPAEAVAPGVPASLHPLPPDAPRDRLGFARWLVARDSPTTARALVNRVWQACFGTGLVRTPEDLGRQGERPSHPELLDWLAVELMEGGWSLKRLHRLIVTSETYRQSSTLTPELLERDPDNRLLARGPRFRVDAEVVRDIALAASGLLDPTIGGPSVYPPAPGFLFEPPASYGPKVWDEARGSDRYRRALYTFRYRSVPYPALEVFDAPAGDTACVRRARSNTPLQALTTLNEPLFLEAARALARRTLVERSGDAERVERAFRRVLSRRPAPAEAAAILELVRSQEPRFRRGELNPWNLATDDPDAPAPLPPGVTMEELAAWTAAMRVILNLDEAITKE